MTEATQDKPFATASAQEVTAAISELEEYRARLIEDTIDAAKRAKIVKSEAKAALDENLSQIDTILGQLRERQSALLAEN